MPISRKIVLLKVIIAFSLIFFIIQYIFTSIYLFLLPNYFRSDAFYSLIVGILFIIGLIYLIYLDRTQTKKKIIIFPIIQIILFNVIDFSTYNIPAFSSFQSFVYLILIISQLVFCLIIGVFLIRFNFNIGFNLISFLKLKIRKNPRIQSVNSDKNSNERKIVSVILIIVIFLCSFIVSLYNLNLLYSPNQITIKPKNYQIQFAFWGSTNPFRYSLSERQSLNKYNVSLISNCYMDNLNSWINNSKYWKLNYPNVKLYANVVGLNWKFVWDGNCLESVQTAEKILIAINSNNLTNVKGIYFDQESPTGENFIDSFPNGKRNAEANEIWKQFFIWVNNTFPPNRFKIKITFYGANVIDIFDHDYDLEVFMRNNIFSVPYFNGYTPMYYEAVGINHNSQVLSADKPNYRLYEWLKMTRDGLSMLGLENEFGVSIGITNNSILGTNIGHTINHQFAGYGYKELITQALIVKSFGIKILTILASSSSHYLNGKWGGVFDSYGSNFLDKFNESVNGINSTAYFKIPMVLDNDFYEYASIDLWMSIGDHLWIVLIAVIIFSSIFFYLKKKSKRKLADITKNSLKN